MGDLDRGWMPWHVFILTCLYCLVPSIALYIGGTYIDEPWILILVIHWIIMVLIPWIFVEVFHFYRYGQFNYFYSSFGSSGDFTGLIMALVFAGIVVLIYWLCCGPLGYDLKSTVQQFPLSDNDFLKILEIAYFILIKPHVEEFFWRRYNYGIFRINEFDFLLVSFFWALTYTVIALLAGAELMWALIICAIFIALGRYLIWVRWRYE
mmetsp:Transcript_17286/g.16940  ORF Transcript_17286/g.16940 Transcript_17286/m.16940 type:complete len:208 (+) Transcript_17286:4-627(+)